MGRFKSRSPTRQYNQSQQSQSQYRNRSPPSGMRSQSSSSNSARRQLFLGGLVWNTEGNSTDKEMNGGQDGDNSNGNGDGGEKEQQPDSAHCERIVEEVLKDWGPVERVRVFNRK